MATVSEIQAELDAGGTGVAANIIRSESLDATYDQHYVVGLGTAPGVSRWCNTTKANTAAQQATEITNTLKQA